MAGKLEANSFSQLTYLLHLVSAINAKDGLSSGFDEYHRAEGNASDEDDVSPHLLNITVLDSMVAVLVQQHEVVAACYVSDTVSVIVEADPNPSTDVEVIVESPLPGCHTLYPLQLAAVSNPDFNSSKNAKLNKNPHQLRIQTNGESFWERVRDSNKWYFVFM
jgi:hypothetical protein